MTGKPRTGSAALKTWRSVASKALDEVEAAHSALGGSGRGRRYATQEINHAYAMMVCSQFQRFCRDLHTEATLHLVAHVSVHALRSIFRARLTEGRKLDQGNPNPGNLGSDFARLGLELWPRVLALDPRNGGRKQKLEQLSRWRNAIAHQDFATTPPLEPAPPLRLQQVKSWRSACGALAEQMDKALEQHLVGLVGAAPW